MNDKARSSNPPVIFLKEIALLILGQELKDSISLDESLKKRLRLNLEPIKVELERLNTRYEKLSASAWAVALTMSWLWKLEAFGTEMIELAFTNLQTTLVESFAQKEVAGDVFNEADRFLTTQLEPALFEGLGIVGS